MNHSFDRGCRWLGVFVILAFSIQSSALAQVDCIGQPKVKLKMECGVITDLSGEPISGATVSVGVADVGSFVKTDESGRWGFLSETRRSGWLQVEAPGFTPFRFNYVTTGKSTTVCKEPVYVRLAIAGVSCPVVTTNAKSGIKR
jgi:hypothetical protein